MRKVSAYQANNGTLFITEEECRQHEIKDAKRVIDLKLEDVAKLIVASFPFSDDSRCHMISNDERGVAAIKAALSANREDLQEVLDLMEALDDRSHSHLVAEDDDDDDDDDDDEG